jgi:AraC family transcriptional regulator
MASSLAPIDEMNRVLDVGPTVSNGVFRNDTRLTQRWRHGAIHAHTLPMSDHVVMTYYGVGQPIAWRDGRRYASGFTQPGSLTLIPRGHEASWQVDGPIEVSHVYLSDTQLKACAESLSTGCAAVELQDRVAFHDPQGCQLLEVLALEARAPGMHSRLFVDQMIDLLCLQLIRAHSSAVCTTVSSPARGLPNWQLRRLTEFVRAHLDQDIGLDELAAIAGLSRFHFCTMFRRATGMSPHRWLVGMRMFRAREMLANPQLSVSRIALDVGYQTPAAFASAFRKAVGMSPSAFRRACDGANHAAGNLLVP